jgi:hypothetical protein
MRSSPNIDNPPEGMDVTTKLSKVSKKRRWYVSHEILAFEPRAKSAVRKLDVWENLILISANSPEQAYGKAIESGRASEGPVMLDGRPGFCKFKGLRELVLVYDDLEDGVELEWHELELTKKEIEKLIRPKRKLHAFKLRNSKQAGS